MVQMAGKQPSIASHKHSCRHCHTNESELSKTQEIETFTIRGHKLPGPMRHMLGLSIFGSSLQIAGVLVGGLVDERLAHGCSRIAR